MAGPATVGLGLGRLRLGLRVGVLLHAPVRVAAGTVLRGLLLPGAATVVGGVEPGAFEVHGDGIEDSLDRAFVANLARLRRRITHTLKELENVSVRATVLVDGHALTVAAGPFGTPLGAVG